jgi:hypothetical protein
MTYKSTTPPLCRYCGKEIAKRTHGLFFGRRIAVGSDYIEKPADIEEVRRLTNEQVVSVRRSSPAEDGSSWVLSATVWDGESYHDEFFCTQTHAAYFGELAARGGQCTAAYKEALRKQKEKADA